MFWLGFISGVAASFVFMYVIALFFGVWIDVEKKKE